MQAISTVCGEIKPSSLGFTTMHEHLLCDLTNLLGAVMKIYSSKIPASSLKLTMENLANLRGGLGAFSSECFTANDIEYTVKELQAFKTMGGNCVVDATPIGGRGNIKQLQQASEISGVNIISCTGLYIADAQPEYFKNLDENALCDIFTKEVLVGIDDTNIKAGFLKCAINTLDEKGGINEYEFKSVRACAKVAAKTGRSIHVHSAFPLQAAQIIDVAKMILSLGVAPEKLLMLHMDSFLRTPRTNVDYIKDFKCTKQVNIDLQVMLLDMGINIGFDSWDTLTTTLPDNTDRLKALVELLKRGYGNQIVLGHDVADKTRGAAYGYTGFTGFIRNAFPTLKELGFECEIAKLVIENPARILSYNN